MTRTDSERSVNFETAKETPMTKQALIDLRDAVQAGEHTTTFEYEAALGEWQKAHNARHGSLDAAKALHEAVLPGWEFGYDGSIAWVNQPDLRTSYRHDSRGGYTARAWLLAILEALIQEGGGES